MKAVFTPAYGAPDVLVVGEIPVPDVGPGEVLVAVEAVAVTAADRRLRSADFSGLTYVPGLLLSGVLRPRHGIQGAVFAGRIRAVGEGVSSWAVGDEVFGLGMHGANAEVMVVRADAPMARRPEGLTAADAVTLPYGVGTAWHFLHTLADVQPDERVLILGGSGGVGPYAVQVAKHLGAHVTATAQAAKIASVEALGADEVIDYGRVDWRTLGAFDVVLDIADVAELWSARASLTAAGRYLTLTPSIGILGAMLVTSWSSQRAMTGVAVDSPQGMAAIASLWREGAVWPVVAGRFAFPDLVAAHRAVEAGEGVGTVVVSMVG